MSPTASRRSPSDRHSHPGSDAAAAPAWVRVTRRVSRFAAAALLALSLVGYAGHQSMLADLLVHFRFQYLLLGLCALAVLVLVRSFRFSAVALLVVATNAAALVPLWLDADPEVPAGARARLMVANVELDNPDHDAVLRAVGDHQIDLLALLEVDETWTRDLAPLRAELPHALLEPRDDRFGIALYSRFPLLREEVLRTGASRRPTLIVTVAPEPGWKLTVIATHPPPPVTAELYDERNTQLARLASTAARHSDGPLALVGDLNLTPFSPWYADLRENSGLVDARSGRGLLGTWPAWFPSALRIPIDHVHVSPSLSVVDMDIGPDIGSDHRPLLVVLARRAGP